MPDGTELTVMEFPGFDFHDTVRDIVPDIGCDFSQFCYQSPGGICSPYQFEQKHPSVFH
jgi:hypothetical protein